MKNCTKCEKLRPLEDFAPHGKARDKRQSWCRDCKNLHRSKFGDKYVNYRDYALRKNYDMTLKDYNLLSDSQQGLCAICNKPENAKSSGGGPKDLAVDHDHNTKVVRSLLCSFCNQALGLIKEDFDIALRLAKYIQHHKNVV